METIEQNTDVITPFTTNDKMLMEKPYSMEDIESAFFGNEKTDGYNKVDKIYPLSKRATPDQGTSSANPAEKKILQSEKKDSEGESRASIPFLSKGESDSSSSSSSTGLSSVPGLSQIPGVSSAMSDTSGAGSSTPTLVMGGFSFVVMPMPGLTMSNIGSALQTGQQMSQFVPGMPSLPG